MQFFKKLVVFASLLFVGYSTFAQKFTNRGREFWVGYGHHQFMEDGTNTQEMVLYFYTGDSAATVTVKIEGSGTPIPPPNGGPWTRTYNIPANTVISIEDPMPAGVTVTKSPNCILAIGPIPKGGGSDCGFDARLITPAPPSGSGGEGIFKKKGIHITSTASIVAYAHIYGSASSGATMLMPVQTWGYNYTSINSEQINATDSYSWMYVVSQHDNTSVRITPSVPSRNGKPAGIPFDIVLNKGEIYQLVGQLTSPSGGFNLTGTTVKSIDNGTGVCYPIAVFSGSSRTGGEAASCGSQSSRDNDMQQNFPEQAWGKRYLTAPFSQSTSPSSFMTSVYKVVVLDPTTVVRRNGSVLTGLQGNKYYKFTSQSADYIEADKPIMVAQYMLSGCASPYGDPEMIYLSPIEQAINDVGFYRNTQESINTQYLTLIIPTAGVSSLKIDGTLFSAIPAAFKFSYPHTNLPGYTVCIKQWAATKGASLARSDSAFTAITYGEGGAESYGYNAGTYINNLNALPFIRNQLDTAAQSPFTCTGTNVEISALLAYKPYQIAWKLSQVPNLFRVSNGAQVTTDTITGNGSTIMPTTDSFLISNRWYYKYSLNFYQFSQLGNYKIPITVKDPSAATCNPFEDFYLDIIVKQKPIADFTFTLPACPTDSVKFLGAGSGGGYSIRGWFWEFPAGSPSADSSQKTGHIFAAPGSYPVKLTVASNEGCSTDTTKTITIAPGTLTTFSVSPTSLCQGGTVTITPGPSSTTEWYWDFGDGVKDTLLNGNPFIHTYNTYGVFSIGHSVKSSGTCNATALPVSITVNANPFASFTINPPGCLPANGNVQFTSTALSPDGQAITAHSWNFGDPGSGALNTSLLAAPSHNYSTVGSYTIKYTATAGLCFTDTTVTTIFNITPSVAFIALNNVCENVAPFNITQGSVTNGVPVTSYYSGSGITNGSTGLFDPSVAGIGTHTIWYHATSNAGGCTDSISQTITVNGVPQAGFTFPAGCLANGNVQFTDTTKLPAGATPPISYTWNFDDVPSGSSNTSVLQNPQHAYLTSGPFNVKLVVIANGCSDSTIIPVTVRIKPQLSYPSLGSVCANVPPFAINSATVTNGVAGSGIYSGPGITNGSTGTFDPALANIGSNTIKYVFTSSLGCADSLTTTIIVNPVPQAGFTFPVSCLPNYNVAFTDTTKLPAGSTGTPTYTWDFGEPSSGGNNTSPIKNPTHNYSSSGPFTVSLIVLSSGCSDTATAIVSVRVQPQLNYPPLGNVCANVPPFPINTATVTNGVTGSGVYSGPGVTNGAAGIFAPSIAGVGVHIIKYIFTSSLNCIDSVQSTITVKGVPEAGFTFPTACLANGTVQFTDTSIIPVGAGTVTHAWNFDELSSGASNTSVLTNPVHSFSNSGPFNVKLVVNANGCSDSTTVPVTVRIKPQLSYPVLSSVCGNVPAFAINSATVTNGVTGTGIYSGPGITNGATGTFNPSLAGIGTHIIKYIFTSALNCIDSVQTTITVKGVPKAGFTFPTTCLANGTVQFTDTSKLPGGSTGSYGWNFGEPSSGANNTSLIQNPQHNFSTSGPFNVKLVVNANGCSDSTTVPVTVRIKPQLSYPPLSSVCGNVPAYAINSATVTNGVTGTGIYSGPGITNGATGTFNPSLAGIGTHIIKYIFTSALNCIDSVQTTITVKGVPKAGFTFPTTCLANGTVQFTDTSKLPGGSTGSYGWNFGEPSSGANNTSLIQNPQHNFSTSGPFNVKLVVNANGCSDSTAVSVTVRIKPQLSYPPLSSVCGNVPAFAIDFATVTNGVSGTGVYSGPGITNGAAGTFNPSLAGVGTHTIKFIFTSALNCIDSVQTTITVKGVPKIGFIFPTTCLANGTVQFTDTSKIPVGSTGSYLWNFGEPTSGGNNTSLIQNPQHSYSTSGPFNVKLVVNANGCSDSTTVPVTVRIQPQLSYPALSSVCGNVPAFAINSANVINGVTGTGVYSGPGIINGTIGTFNPSLAGVGTHIIKYIFTSALNCIDSVQTTITVKAVPKAGFTFPTSCLPDGNVQFSDTSKPVITPNTKSYQWNFGDGSVVNNSQAPLHLYAGAGPYSVKQVVSYNGCSDSTTLSVAVRVQPQLAYGPFNAVCGNIPPFSVATGVVTNNVNGGVKRYKGIGITDSINGIFSPAIAGAGTHTIKFYYRSLLGCIDSVAATVTVKPVPVASFTYPDTCLTSNLVQFGSVAISGASYSWNFGDPSSGGNNVSNLANPSHSYNTFGSYSVKLTVLVNGCSDDSTVNAIFRLQPVINFPPLASVCQANDTINIAKAVVTNGVPSSYPGKYSGPGVFDTLGKFNPIIAGAGTHTITYKFTSSSGCIATRTSTITVWPRPVITGIRFNNTPDSNICIDKPLVVSSQVTLPSGNVTKWDWRFGDGLDTILVKNDSLIHSYKLAQAYRISLTTTSNNGCVSDSFGKLIYVRSLPQVSFVSPTGICMPNGSVSFKNQTVIPFEDSTRLTYLWNFGDNTPTSVLVNPMHVYNTILAQTDVILTAKSGFGCVAADTATILFYPKPLADFTALPNPVCQGKAITFTNITTSANIASATWDFGNGSNPSTAAAPSIIYTSTGEFQPSLIVASINGCRDTAKQKVRVYLQPIVDAGKSFVVDAGTAVIFQGRVNSPNLALSWSPALGLSSASIATPSLKALANQTYTLTAVGQGGCTASDSLTVNILLALKIPNAFSPNGDGKNDVWDLTNLKDYPSSSVEVFNRYGQSVYLSNGRYTKAWDGTFKGNKLPEGTYYYIIDVKNGVKPVAGYVAIIR